MRAVAVAFISVPLALANGVPAGSAATGSGTVGDTTGCGWHLNTLLPVPTGFSRVQVTGTDGEGRFVGQAIVPSSNAPFAPATGPGIASAGPFGADVQAVVWRDGQVDLLPAPDSTLTWALGANRRGDVVGYANPPEGQQRAVLWHQGRFVELAAPAQTDATAVAVNDAGLIVGTVGTRVATWTVTHPGTARLLDAPAGVAASAVAVTGNGLVAATLTAGDSSQPATGRPRLGLHPLRLPEGSDAGALQAAAGRYLAGVTESGPEHAPQATLWTDGTPRLLSGPFSQAMSVDQHGNTVGSQNDHAALWTDNGQTLLPEQLPGQDPVHPIVITTSVAVAIAGRGQTIAGTARNAFGDNYPVLWHCTQPTPITNQPSTSQPKASQRTQQ